MNVLRVHGLGYVALRWANVYGPRQDPHVEARCNSGLREPAVRRRAAHAREQGLAEPSRYIAAHQEKVLSLQSTKVR